MNISIDFLFSIFLTREHFYSLRLLSFMTLMSSYIYAAFKMKLPHEEWFVTNEWKINKLHENKKCKAIK